ncbi:DUF695 domain-containing protein [Flavobacterium sp. ASW18X]|uniref:DUF695 domain-containing protein n=1 Tax=Flavobacterium sp. ASW18X TaxID=2572595 RepID=UPI0010AEC6B6|nr:DUF695 domain-containing protein [Flavobacterium sp. ASW18X]TKD65839.1 DUF695 domain-containing protein [Flavobacterium sp. ASW18X]
MSFFKKLFNNAITSKTVIEQPFTTYKDFWNWFTQHQETFYKVIAANGDITKVFFDELSPKLEVIHPGIWFLCGMYNDTTAELILTPDGIVKNVVFVEELIAEAPELPNWRFTALKPPSIKGESTLEKDGFSFSAVKLNFYSIDDISYPDQISITVTHQDFSEETKDAIFQGVCLYLDNYIGELKFITLIDDITVIHPSQASQELVPINKLKDFLIWREKEFIEKYTGTRRNTDTDNYSLLEATLENGNPLIAVVNMDLLNWDSKASHPWIATFSINYKEALENGMPNQKCLDMMNGLEDAILEELKDEEGYLNIGRETADHLREIFFACKDFRRVSKVLNRYCKNSDDLELKYTVYKDKYWQSFNRYIPNPIS